jgi:small ubiquitin-related modifier
MFFKVKKTTKMEKILSAYAQRRGVALTSLRFMLDGTRIKETDTPKMLELDDNDQIDVMLEALGGN